MWLVAGSTRAREPRGGTDLEKKNEYRAALLVTLQCLCFGKPG